MVDPEAQLVEVYVPDGGHAKLVASAAGDEAAVLAPLEGEMALGRWWSDV